MKKRFTLMMMVMCFLMSIPLKMMAYDEVTAVSHYLTGTWGPNSNFKFNTTDGKIYTCKLDNVPSGTQAIWFRIVKEGKEYGPGNGSSSDLVLTGTYQQIFEGTNNSLKIVPASGKTSYTITYNYETNQIKYDAPESGGIEGGGGSTTDDTWAETENRLKGRVYTQGYYLAGNFFSFSGDKVTYDDAVFKFQQQKNDENGNAIYKVEIPASLTAHAQIMSVNELGKAVKVYGPGSAYDISSTSPSVNTSTGLKDLAGSVTQAESDNYWNITSRNGTDSYTDGIYEVFITIDKNTGEPSKWEFKHIATKRVAFFISDAKNATALPVYDSRNNEESNFSNKFFASVNLNPVHSYYVISNMVVARESEVIKKSSSKYGTIDPNRDILPTTNKLFLLGNGGNLFETSNEHNQFSPNEEPMKPGAENQGSLVVEYNPSNGNNTNAKTDKHLGIRGQVIIRDARTKITSVSMVGDAIPGTLNEDNTWNFKSNAADMTYDENEKCYKVTLVTTAADGEKKFRFVGNHNKDINWYEDSKTDASMKAKSPYEGSGEGHAATSYDPNKVSYTEKGVDSEEDSHIIWNRPAGRWTVRLYFYTYSDGNDPKTDYYYTITANRELELRDFEDVVYKSLDNKRNIRLRGDYKYFRTWSAVKAWKISKDVDIFVVDAISKEGDCVKFSLKKISADETDNVIPSNTGVILATKKTAENIDGGAEFFERASLTTYNTMVIPMEEYNASAATADYTGKNLLKPLIYSQVVPTVEHKPEGDVYNYLFGFYRAKKVSDNPDYRANDFLLGFWLSNGTGDFYNNSAYLPIDEATAEKMNLGVSYEFQESGSSAKKVPGVIFDFANVGGTTGINEVVNQSAKLNDGKYYTLSGQQVEKPTAGGIYIHNGKKYIVK